MHQLCTLRALLEDRIPDVAAHGDCVGADAQFHDICSQLGVWQILVFPTHDGPLRAHCSSTLTAAPTDPLARNRRIVEVSDLLVAAPDGPETLRSGTWSTVRHARRRGRRVVTILRDGSAVEYR